MSEVMTLNSNNIEQDRRDNGVEMKKPSGVFKHLRRGAHTSGRKE